MISTWLRITKLTKDFSSGLFLSLTIAWCTFCMTWKMIQHLCQLFFCILQSVEHLSRRMYTCWRTIFIWMPSGDMLIPEMQKGLYRLCIISVKCIHRWYIFHPKETMNVAASTMLPFISPPVILDFKLWFYDLFKENLPPFLKVVSSYSRIIIEIIHSCLI